MLLLWLPLSILALYWLLDMLYERLWSKGLSVRLSFEEKTVSEGDTAILVETVINDKRLPLPVIQLSFKIDRGITIDEDRNASVSDMTNVLEYFGLFAYEKVVRRQPVLAARRGYYLLESAEAILPDFMTSRARLKEYPQYTDLYVRPSLYEGEALPEISRQIVGEILSRRRLYQDAFSFRGIREYLPGDPLSSINWKASARTGDYMVTQKEYTGGLQLKILLNVEPPTIRYRDEILENGIRLAYTLALDSLDQGIPVSFATNGRDALSKEEIRVASGTSALQIRALGEAMARIRLDLEPRRFHVLLKEEAMATLSDTVYCMISTRQDEQIDLWARELALRGEGLTWICPVERDEEKDRSAPAPILFHCITVHEKHQQAP